jgi:hypothetical protein
MNKFPACARSSALLLSSAAFLASCASTDLSKAVDPYRNGDFNVAAAEILKIDGNDKTDGVWIQMEKGSILKSAGLIAQSQAALQDCQNQMDSLLADADDESIAVGGLAGAGAVMTDDRQCNYVGALYESQLVCALQAMNGLLMSDLSQAQAAISLLRSRVDEANTIKEKVAEYLAKVREENAEERKANAEKYGESITKFDSDVQLTDADTALKAAYSSWADTSTGIGLYVAEVVGRESGRSGEFVSYMTRAAQDARKQSWNQAAYAALAAGQDAALANISSAQPGNTTYVIVEAGLAPRRQLNTQRMAEMKQKDLDVELPGLSDPLYSGKASVVIGDATHVALLKKNEFDMNYPDMEYRAVLGKVIKEAIKVAGAATALASDDRTTKLIGAAFAIGGAIASAAQGADLRSWDCLPYQYRVVAVPTPADGQLKIVTDEAEAQVSVVPGTSNIVVATSISRNQCSALTAPISAIATN